MHYLLENVLQCFCFCCVFVYNHLCVNECVSLYNSPQAQMSTGLPYASFLNTSGDRYPGVPANPSVKTQTHIHTHTID